MGLEAQLEWIEERLGGKEAIIDSSFKEAVQRKWFR